MMKFRHSIAILGLGIICSYQNSHAQILENIGKKIEKKAEKKIAEVLEDDTEKVADESPKSNHSSTTGPFKNIPLTTYDFKTESEIVFFDDFSKETPGAMASRWTSNGTGAIARVNGFEGQWLKLYTENTYKIKELVRIPENCTLEFDLLTLADSKDGITIDFGFDHQKGVSKHYYLAYRNPVNIEASYRFDQFKFTSKEVNPNKSSEIEADMSYFVNDIMKVKIRLQGDRMTVYIDKYKVLDTEMADPVTKKYFYLAVENKKNQADIYLGNVKIAQL
ncbi:hypothetical protein GCM10027051_30510 [Niabella terrae]